MKKRWLAILAALLIAVGILSGCGGTGTGETLSPASRYEREVIRLVNEIRVEHGLNELKASDAIMEAAHARLKELDISPSHTRPDGSSYYTILPDYGLSPYAPGGENICFGGRTPEEAVESWMNSPGHRENILREGITLIGVGYNPRNNYWIQVFTHD